MVESDARLLYETAYGNFLLSKDFPYFVGVSDNQDTTGEAKFADSAFLVMFQAAILEPSNGTVDSASTERLVFHYDLLAANSSVGKLFMTYEFFDDRNKITASFVPSIERPEDFQIVWLTFTTWRAVDTAYPSDIEQRFDDLKPYYGSVFDTLYATGDISIPGAIIRPDKTVGSLGGPSLRIDASDAAGDIVASYAGKFGFGGRSGNAVLVMFSSGKLLIDPTLRYAGYPQSALAYGGLQRKTFYDGNRYWMFWKHWTLRQIDYSSSVDGKGWSGFGVAATTVGDLTYNFDVTHYGKSVAVVFIDGNVNEDHKIRMRTGRIHADAISWDSDTKIVYSSGQPALSYVSAAFSPQGSQIGIAFGEVYFTRFIIYTCSGPSSLGLSDCATGTPSPPGTLGSGQIPDTFVSTVAFDAGGDSGKFVIVRGNSGGGQTDVYVHVSNNGLDMCGSSGQRIFRVDNVNLPIANDGLLTAAASGNIVSVFLADTVNNLIYKAEVDTFCGVSPSPAPSISAASPKYATAGTEQDGNALYLFYVAGGAIRKARAVPAGLPGLETEDDFFVDEGAVPTLSSYTNPSHLTAAQHSSNFVPLMFTTGLIDPPGTENDCTSAYCLYYVNYPLPLNGEASVNNPWATKLGAPLVTEVGGVVSPTTGLLATGQTLIGGTPALSIIYREPGLFYRNAGTDAKFTGAEPYQILPGIYYDLPWIDGVLHMQGGQQFPLTLTGISGSFRWYNGTRGIPYTLMYDGTNGVHEYHLTFPSGAYVTFEPDLDYENWYVSYVYLDTTGNNFVFYWPPFTDAFESVTDSSGRAITVSSSQITYGNGKTSALSKTLGSFSDCSDGLTSDSGTLQVIDAIGRATKYYVCHWKLIKLESPNGGRVDYTYADYSLGQQVRQGTEAYSLPLLKMDIHNESGSNVTTRSLVFNWNFQNGEAMRALVNTTDKSGVIQGSNEYIFSPAAGTASVRIYDSAGQILYYDMETCTASPCGGSNLLKDLSGNANHGTIGGTGSTFPFGRSGKAGGFGGAAWIQAADANSLDATRVTLSAWINPSSVTGTKRIVSKWGDAVDERSYLLSMGDSGTNGKIRFAVYRGGTNPIVDSAANVAASSWWHVVGTYDGRTATIYINGAPSGSATGPEGDIQATSTPMRIGDEGDDSGTYLFAGTIDEVHVFSRALSPEEIGILGNRNALKKGEQSNWYSINDQPHLVEGFVGDETTASVVTQDTVDDWGNQIYHRDALGNETFASYANTNHQSHFYAPGSLTKNTGATFNTEFIDFSEGTFPSGGEWSATSTSLIQLDYAEFDKMTPSLQINAPPSGSTTVVHTSPVLSPRFVEFRAKSAGGSVEIRLGTNSDDLLLGVQFSSLSSVIRIYNKYVANWVDCTYASTGLPITFVSDSWYRFTFEIDKDSSGYPWKAYVNGIDLSCGATTRLVDTSGLYKLTFQVYASTDYIGWVDDIKLYDISCETNPPGPGCDGYFALDVGVSGLRPRQVVELRGEDGTVIEQLMQTGTNTLFLGFNSPLTGPYKYYENGHNAQTTMRIYAEDGTLEYQSPQTRFFVGERYTYTPPRSFADELIKTRTGALYWPNTIYADEVGFCGEPGISCSDTWTWEPADIRGYEVGGAVNGTWVHVTPFGYGTRSHWFKFSDPTTHLVPSYFTTYIRIPEGKTPDGIGLIAAEYGSSSCSSSTTCWRQAYWGHPPSGEGLGLGIIISQKNMGPVPMQRNRWIQLTVSQADFGLNPIWWWSGFGYQSAGGGVQWDVTTTPSTTSLTVTGLSSLGTGLRVGVYDSTNDVLVASGTQSNDTASVNLYKPAPAYQWSTFPIQAKIKIYRTSPNYDEYYLGPLKDLWPGDTFRYVGESGFFGYVNTQLSIHTAQIGAKRFSGDCTEAVLCYDMETLTEGSPTVGTGAVTVKMLDLSGRGNHGTIGGVPKYSVIGQSATGLGTTFNAGSDEIAVTMPAVNTATGGWNTVSFWMYWTGTSGQMPFGFSSYDLYFSGTYFGFNTANGDLWGIDNTGLANTLVYVTAEFYNGPGTSSKLYINGVQQTLSQKIGTTLSRTATTNAKIASWPNDGIHRFAGTIDQVQVFNRALTDAEIRALYHSRTPGAPQVYLRPQTNGFVEFSRVPYEGTYLYAAASYDSKGHPVWATDVGRDEFLGGGNVTTYTYSAIYGSDYLTQVIRPKLPGETEGRHVYYAYDFQTGVKYGTLDIDCRRSRTQYDVISRPVSTSIYDTDPNEVLHLDMETASATSLKDVSCAGNADSRFGQTITMTGTTETSGVEGAARNFNGASDWIGGGNNVTLQISTGTVSAWVKTTGAGTGYRGIVVKQSAYGMFLLDNLFGIYDWNAGTFRSTGVNLADGQWHHVAFSFQSGVTSGTILYVDGVSKLTTTMTVLNQNVGLSVGAGSTIPTQLLLGSIDDVRVFNAVRSPSDIAGLWRFKYKLVTISSAAYDDMVADSDWSGYQFTSVTSYDATSIPRRLFLDMETRKLTAVSGKFNDVIEDLSGHGNHVENFGATVSTGSANCKVGSCYLLDGTSSYLEARSTSSLDIQRELSASAWIKVDSSGPTLQYVFAKGKGGQAFRPYIMYVQKTGGSWYLKVGLQNLAGTTITATSASIATGSLIHVGFTYDGYMLQTYVSGVPSGNAVTLAGPLVITTDVLRVGHLSSSIGTYFKGQIDELHIFDTWLSAFQISNLYIGANNEKSHMSKTYDDGLGRTVRSVVMDMFGRKITTVATLGWNDKPIYSYLPSGGYFTFTYDYLGRTLTTQTPTTTSTSTIDQWIHPVAGISKYYNTWQSQNGGCTSTTHYDCVNDDPYDDATSYVIQTTTTNAKESHLMEDMSVPAGFTDIDVTIEYRCAAPSGSAGGDSRLLIVVGAEEWQSTENNCIGTWQPFSSGVLETSPSGDEWTAADVTALECGYVSDDNDLNPDAWVSGVRCRIQVTYPAVSEFGMSQIITSEKARMIESIDAVGRKAYSKTDLLGRTVETAVWNPATGMYGNFTSTKYNALSKVTESIDAEGQRTTTYHNLLGRPKMTIFPDGTYSVVYYDDNLRAFKVVDVMGRISISAYDNLGRVTSVTLKGSETGTPHIVTYGYDPVYDDLKTIDNGTARITRGYDSLHRMVAEKLEVPAGTAIGTIGYGYDAAGKVLNITYPVGAAPFPEAVYTYDSLGRPIQVVYGGLKYAVLTYDSFGRLDNISYWQGTATNTLIEEKYAYDARERITQIKVYKSDLTATYMQLDYTYNKASEITASTDNMYVSDAGSNGVSNPKTITYAYDGNGRLAKAVGPFGASQATEYDCYDYDAVGNIWHWGKGTSSCPTSGTTYYTYNYDASGWNKLTSITNLVPSFTYNAAGSMLSKVEGTTTTYAHDFQQQLTNVVSGSGTHTYSYDGLGRRVKTVDPSQTMYFMYMGSKMLYSRVGTAGTETAYVYVGDRLLLRKEGTGTTPEARYYHLDITAGNVRLITYYTTSVQVDAKYRYKPFGDILILKDPATDPSFKFAQQKYDSAVRLYQMGARYHDPVVGRFIQRDPIGPGYSYAYNSPLMFIDPSGMAGIARQWLNFWETHGKTITAAVFLVAAIATSIPSGGSSLVLYALVFGTIAGVIAVALTYVASGGQAALDEYINAFALGFSIGAVIGGGIGFAFGVRGAARLAAGKASLSGVEKAGLSGAERGSIGQAPKARVAADGGVAEARSGAGMFSKGGRLPHKIEAEYTGRVRGWLGKQGADEVIAQNPRLTPYGRRIVDLEPEGGRFAGSLHEVKGGLNRMSLNQRAAEEIVKDQWLVDQGYTVYWHFFTQPTDELASALYSAGIRVVVW